MKKLFVLLTVLFLGQLSAAEVVWNNANTFKDWKRVQRCSTKIENDVLTVTDIAFDCCIVNDYINVNPADFNALTIRYKAEGITTPSTGEFFFVHGNEKYSEKRRWNLPTLISDGKWHTITIRPKNLQSWLTGGNITSLRLDMVNKPGGKIEISEIKLHKISGNNSWSGKDLAKWNKSYRCETKFENDIITINLTKTDAQMFLFNADIDPAESNTFVMVYRATGTPASVGELYFARGKENFSDARRWRLPALIADGKWHTLRVEDKAINNQNAWYKGGNITQLRLDPTNAAGGKLEIKEIRFERKSGTKPLPTISLKPADEPVWQPVVSQLKKKASDGAYFQAKMIKAPQDTFTGKMMRPFFVRRKLVLKDTPVHAKLQFTADDYSQVVINGQEAAFSNSWREAVVCDVAHLLKKGENVLGFQYYNKDTWGGVFGELYVQYADGTYEKISTDKQFKSTDKEIKNWATTQVDDSKWDTVVEQNGPPNRPWVTKLNYIDFKNLQKITKAQLSNNKFKWGETFQLQINCEGNRPTEDVSIRVVLYSRDTVQWADTVTIPAKDLKTLDARHWSTSFRFELPYYIPTGKYEVRLESPQFSVSAGLRKNLMITLDKGEMKNPKFSGKPSFCVVRIGNAPQFQLNGKPFYMSLGKAHSYFGDQSDKISRNAPFSAVNPSANYEKWHPRYGIYDFTEFDRVIAKVVRSYPDAYIIFGLDLYVPANFHHKFPDDMTVEENGTKSTSYKYSIFSKEASKYLTETAIKAIEYIENSPYANRVIGYRIGGGYTTEFLGWEPSLKLDYSKAAQRRFKEYAGTHYPALKDFRIPTFKDRSNVPGGALLWNPAENLSTVAYFDAYSNANAEMVATICSGAKDYLKKKNAKKVVGTYFGYVATLNWTGIAQMRAHFALKRLLNANAVDFIMSPNSYPLRNLGDIVGDMKPFATLNDYNVVSFIEDDTRTHNTPDVMSTPGSRSQVITEKQSINVFRRNIGVALCRNQPENYNPMFKNSYNFESLERDIAIRRVLGDFYVERPSSRTAEVAIVISEKAIVSMPNLLKQAPSGYIQQLYNADGTVEKRNMVRNIPNYEMYVGNQGRFLRTGAPVDIILAEALDKAKPYKVYVFMNSFNYDKQFLDTVKKLQQKQCTLLWVYAPGFAYQNNASVAAMNQLTGFQFKQLEKDVMPAVTLADGSWFGTPTVRVKPVFAVTDPQVRVLGRYEDGSVGLASRKIGKSLSFFSGPWQLELPFLSQVLKESGVHIFSETGDPFEANDSLVVLHARKPGKKTIKLPRKAAAVLDVYANRIVARNTDKIEYSSELHETRVFYYGNDAEELQKRLQKSGKF